VVNWGETAPDRKELDSYSKADAPSLFRGVTRAKDRTNCLTGERNGRTDSREKKSAWQNEVASG